jgi:hypothetical protein
VDAWCGNRGDRDVDAGSSMNESISSEFQGGGAIPPTGLCASFVSRKEEVGQDVVMDVDGEGHGQALT